MPQYLLSIDQGTTNSRAYIFSPQGKIISHHELSLNQTHPSPGWTEQDPEQMWSNTLICCQEALRQSKLSATDILAIGISNQRETTLIWDRKTGEALHPAIVWHDRRSDQICKQFENHPINRHLQEKTGLLLDPYFSASKIMWLLDNIPQARQRAEKGELAFGTVDTFLLWRFTKGTVHATDATNASRTLLFNIKTQTWDKDILAAFNIPVSLLPEVFDSAAEFGDIDAEFLGRKIPIRAMVGDQQAATIGQACFKEGMIKATYGTGCFVLVNTGAQMIQSQHRLLSTIAYRLKGKVTYGLEGSVFSAGSIIKWLRDQLQLIPTAADSETCAKALKDNGGVYLIPAFSGLGAPYWIPAAKAAILGLTSNSKKEHLVRAGLEAIGYQSKDLLDAIAKDYSTPFSAMRVDGGMAVNNWFLQFVSDLLNLPLHRPACTETTALGAAYLAGLASGVYQSLDEIASLWEKERAFLPEMSSQERERLYQGWMAALKSII